MRELTVDGRAVAMLDEGAGPPAILLHSSGMAGRQWNALAARLSPHRRVVRPDFWGAGATAAWPADRRFEYGADVDLAEAVLCDVTSDGARADLVGHSYGGLIALQLALRQPARVRAVAVYEPVAFGALYSTGDAAAIAGMAQAEAEARFSDATIGGSEEWLEKFIDFWNGPGAWRILPGSARASFVKNGTQVFAEVRSLLTDRTTHTRYAEITAPTLLIDGDRSPSGEQWVCQTLARALPHARLETIAGAGHMGPLTHAELVNQRIADFLRAS